jgi:hypothetical protein
MKAHCAVAAVAGLVVAGCGVVEAGDDRAGDDRATIRSGALAIDVPAGWYGSDAEPEGPGPWAPTLRVATLSLSARPTDQGQHTQWSMRDQDILITIHEYGKLPTRGLPRDIAAVALPIEIRQSDLGTFEGFRKPVATRAFVVDGFAAQLWVVFGADAPTPELLAEANRALSTLEVS